MIYDVDTLWKAESGLVWSQLVPGAPLTKEIGVHVFYRCQCTTVETVRELTEFAKCIPGFVDLFLNDQVSHCPLIVLHSNMICVLLFQIIVHLSVCFCR